MVICSQNIATGTNQQLCSGYHRLSSLRPAPGLARSFKKTSAQAPEGLDESLCAQRFARS